MDTTTYLVIGLVALGITIAVFYFILRWALSMKRQLWNQKQMVKTALYNRKEIRRRSREVYKCSGRKNRVRR